MSLNTNKVNRFHNSVKNVSNINYPKEHDFSHHENRKFVAKNTQKTLDSLVPAQTFKHGKY